MSKLPPLSDLLSQGTDLQTDAAEEAARAMADPAVDPLEKKAFLLAMAQKGETPTELAAFGRVFRELSRNPDLPGAKDAIDVVGTGGDHSGSFNISTAASLILAASGIPVIKHGNRSVTSQCGSADLLESLGIPLECSPEVLRAGFEELNFAFLFAPAFHPAFKAVTPVRKELAAEGHRTLFNLLGPLTNPGHPGSSLIGVFSPDWVVPMAEAARQMGAVSALVVNSQLEDGITMDELTCAGKNTVAGIGRMSDYQNELKTATIGLQPCDFDALRGGNLERNLELLHALAEGTAPNGLRDTVAFNVAMALLVCGRAEKLRISIEQAFDLMHNGALPRWLERARTFFAS